MKRFFTISVILVFTMLLIPQSAFSSNIKLDNFNSVQSDINAINNRRVLKTKRYSIKCPKCKIKNYYTNKNLRKGKVYCSNCGYSFRPGIILNRGQRIKILKRSNTGGAIYKKI